MRVYEGNDNYGKPKQDYVDHIASMDMDKLKKETKDKIWLSAFANNNPRSDYHWHVDVCYDELMKRTGDDKVYTECFEKVKASI